MRRRRTRFWVVWATRDARRHWVQVVSIALLIAFGTGMYSAMSSMSRWRVASADASYRLLRMHDLRVTLAEASFAREGALRAALDTIPARARVIAAEERLSVPVQVDASTGSREILVSGRIVGASVRPSVDRTDVERGRGLGASDSGRPVALLERNFAAHYDLPAAGRLTLSGGSGLRYVGQVKAPEYFIVTAPGADFGAESSFAAVFTSLATAQALTGRPHSVNELVLRAPAANAAALRAQIASALQRRLPGVGFTFTRGADEPAHRLIYEDAKNDQQMLDIFAFLLLGAAAFAAFNLISRSVEAQRREIGIGMALGVRPMRLALRPLLLGGEIALLGVALGIPLGLVANEWLGSVLRTWFPLPVVEATFEPDLFITGALLGFGLPLIATLMPVRRAVRVPPVEAIRVGARAARSSGLAWIAKGLRLPGGSLASMPVRNVLRTPRRTLLTLLGVGAVVSIVFSLSGIMDSFDATLRSARDEALAGDARRMTVDLVTPQPADGRLVRAIERADVVGAGQRSLRLPVTVAPGDEEFKAFLEVVPPSGPLWRPTVTSGSATAGGLVIAQVAAKRLGVGVGDLLTLRHPVPGGDGAFVLRTARLPVAGIHASPFRFLVYAPASMAPDLGLAGLVNRISVVPAAGADADAVKRALLGVPGVAAVQGASASTDAVDQRMEQFTQVLIGTVAIALAMAILMAYNASAINADERAREHATMFAFGVTQRRVLALGVAEAFIVGVLATLAGGAGGYLLLRWIVNSSMPETMPDVGMLIEIQPLTFAFAILAGVVAVALAPLLTRRRLARTDIPSTLRVVE